MIKVKHVMDPVEKDDGQRLWVEPIGLCKDMCKWCKVDTVLSELGPPMQVWDWFEEHQDGYEYFRGVYHEALSKSPHKPAMQMMAAAASRQNFTLLHSGDDDCRNTATALHEFLSELSAYCPPE
jgi:uncharacterized protein YeaO (DUF488 family)